MTYFLIILLITYTLHKKDFPSSLKLYCFFYLIADVLNPLIFLNNEDMYLRSSWGYTGDFDFQFSSLIKAYEKSYLIVVFIIMFNYFFIKLRNTNNYNIDFNYVSNSKYSSDKSLIYFYSYLILSSITFIIFYQLKIGVTGLSGEYQYPISGIVHYYRSYLSPLLVLFLLKNISKISYKIYISIFIYSIIIGITSGSRFVAMALIVLIAPLFLQEKLVIRTLILVISIIISFMLVTVSRDITYVDFDLNFFSTMVYTFTNLVYVDLYYHFDTLTGRLSSAQGVILANTFSGNESCSNIYLFFLGKPICENIALDLYQIDLSGTEFGIGLAIIPSITVYNSNWYSYIIPAFLVALFIYISDLVYKEMKRYNFLRSLSFYYLLFSIIFLFAGPLLFFYVLTFLTLLLIAFKKYI